MNTYTIQLRGQVDVADLNAMSPQQMTMIRMTPDATWLRIFTDQAGFVGLLVHLHRLGLRFVSVQWEEELKSEGERDGSSYTA